MIEGVGTDIVKIERIDAIYGKYQRIFLNKILHRKEISICQNWQRVKLVNYLAKRFAAKEALAKAIGSGIGSEISFKNVAILNNQLGAPYFWFEASIKELFTGKKVHLSVADDWPIAVAFVVVSR